MLPRQPAALPDTIPRRDSGGGSVAPVAALSVIVLGGSRLVSSLCVCVSMWDF
jgi:hypothetical protein